MRHSYWTTGLALAAAWCAGGQTLIDLRTQSRDVDFSGAASTRPTRTGTTLPSNCRAGELFFKTDETPGSNLYGCTATGVWNRLGNGGGGLPDPTGNQNEVLYSNGTGTLWGGAVRTVTPGAGLVTVCSNGAGAASGDCWVYVDDWYAATQPGNNVYTGSNDFSGSASMRLRSGSALPATCFVAEAFFLTSASAGQNWYGCTSQNTWTLLGGNGSGGASSTTSHALTFDGSTTALADSSTVVWTCGSGSSAQCTTNWTPPAGVNWVRVAAWSGGAGGTGGGAGTGAGGQGGGGGAYIETVCPVTPSVALSIAVGSGGPGGSNAFSAPLNGGNTGVGTCFTLLGGINNGSTWGGVLNNTPTNINYAMYTPGVGVSFGTCTPTGANAPNAIRPGIGGCGAGQVTNAGSAGTTGGTAIDGGGGGGGGAWNNATAGIGGTSGLGGAGGNGGAWTSGGGLVNCTAGTIPGGGGGAGGGESNPSATHLGCAGARGEVRVYYTR